MGWRFLFALMFSFIWLVFFPFYLLPCFASRLIGIDELAKLIRGRGLESGQCVLRRKTKSSKASSPMVRRSSLKAKNGMSTTKIVTPTIN